MTTLLYSSWSLTIFSSLFLGSVEPTTSVDNVGPVDNGESVIVKPSFSFQCSDEGLYPHSSDCAKFWLCAKEGQPELEPELYLCPDGYWVKLEASKTNHLSSLLG